MASTNGSGDWTATPTLQDQPEAGEKFEAVVVGGGFAGLSTAMKLAKEGVQVVVLERGKFPGSKNVTGGILYGQSNTDLNLDRLVPEVHDEAPVERPVTEYKMHNVAGKQVSTYDVTDLHHHNHEWSYSVLRAELDKWFAERVHEEAKQHGGGVLDEVTVTGPLFDDHGRVIGVRSEELDPIEADMVVAADGATSVMAREGGIRGWLEPDEWYQGVKVVLDLPAEEIEERFDLAEDEGSARLVAGNLFDGVRGGGFVYTNRDTLSVGTVFHLDAVEEAGVEPHRLLDRLLEHPLMSTWVGDHYEELEYSAKLIPDGKKTRIKKPANGRLVAVGDAAGHLIAQGPIIKGLNLGVSGGMLAGEAFLEARERGSPERVGSIYADKVQDSYIWKELAPRRYRFAQATAEYDAVNGLLERFLKSGTGRKLVGSGWGQRRLKSMFSSPFWAGMMPDLRMAYATLPEVIAEETGEPVKAEATIETPSIDDRIADLEYDTDVGNPHIILEDTSVEASGAAVHTCPVSARDSSRGCYREETITTPDGEEKDIVAFDMQPCIECGTCALTAETDWDHPRGGKGVHWEHG